ncbi:OsmC family protein [Leucobacter luti]|uniref:Organic hydroperoxide reductase OsmC/OhrA n=1 Tax=Leucobacter luti TaxID=340320 RepID=A0A4Q7U4Y4_9MICO|nr:OsmC family protein [Leucobacter luti]MBL3700462.1 OsmC family peroxiredoxin [Leucobacter luti]RZT68704.1 organic hydroperoxide reductase OsmC/OhrA [Leucobacter luti]
MMGVHEYRIDVEWAGNRGTGTSGYREYGRELTIHAAHKPPLAGSADPTFHGDADRWNPEELLVTALAQCHMLSYLHMAVRAGVVVRAYTDAAVGTMRQEGVGGAFTDVLLRPRVTVADASMVDAALAAHGSAREACFIANSVNFPVRHEPEILVAGAAPDSGA